MQFTNEFINQNSFDAATNLKDELQSIHDLTLKLEQLVVENEDSESKVCIAALKNKISNLYDEIKEFSACFNQTGREDDNILSSVTRPEYSMEFKMRDTNILIADDNNVNNYVFSQMLSHFNINTDVTTNGETAIELFKKKDYDIVMLDYLMPPGINGVETARRIRELGERGKNQLIIGLTSNSMSEFRNELGLYNVELILFKPVKYQHMSIILRRELPDKIIS